MVDLHCSTASAATPGSVVAPSSTNPKESENEETSKHKKDEKGEKDNCVGGKRRKITSIVWKDFDRVVKDDKVTATLDNASTNDVMINHLKDWISRKGALIKHGDIFHVRCCAHILNLIVQDGLVELRDALMKIRHMVKWINSSPSRFEKWKYALSQSRLSDKKSVSLDVPTRWNSTYEMLHNALEVKIAFERLAELDNNFKILPTMEEWEKCQKIEQCLEIFYDATMHMWGCKYPTANFYFKDVCDIISKIRGWKQSKDDCISSMAITMRLKYEKYWKGANLFMALGAILDPRYKMTLIMFCMRRICGNIDTEHYVSQIKFDVADLYAKYASKFSSSCTQSIGDLSDSIANRNESSDGSFKKEKKNYNDDFKKFVAEEYSVLMQPSKSELDRYLEESLFPDVNDDSCCDILHWWKVNGPNFQSFQEWLVISWLFQLRQLLQNLPLVLEVDTLLNLVLCYFRTLLKL
ncbi:zinc finger BED domain-containing protein RICESLEEPER 2-like [Telopea speciosissima]|uniref:zinc finger BED domain-containing protein RICESLEEPER 2-like n=1 Tax=Telopea speciosissima TaxID=54955 RepID=UPI001CC53039|nr:zinc finger BED domain-containing protein RICESLEEPER 2-like [Telopea speciosissima]